MSFTSGLHWSRVRLTSNLELSVICFAQDNLESNWFEWLATLESGCPNSEYWCELGLVLFVIGMCTHFDILNCIFHLSVWRI